MNSPNRWKMADAQDGKLSAVFLFRANAIRFLMASSF
jgi:hypothetical protein